MAESKFLPLQDVNGDGLNDVCDDAPQVPPDPCPTCTPNSFALVPNWRSRSKYEPFLNEKTCEYQITVTTKYTSALANLAGVDADSITEEQADSALQDIFSEYEEHAIQALLNVYNKDDSEGSKDLLRGVIEVSDWMLGVRPTSRLRVLYSVPYDNLNAIPEAEDDEEQEEESGPITVSYDANELAILMLKLRKGLWLYARNLKVYRAVDGANLLFLDDNSVFNLDEYGDYGFNKNASIMGRLLPALDYYLNSKGFNIQNVGSWRSKNVPISRLTFEFSAKYKLKKLTIEPSGCSERKIAHTGKLTALKQSGSPWADSTALAYFAAMRDLVDGLTARTPIPWKELIINHTYPPLYDTAASNSQIQNQSDIGAAISCIGEALADEGKQLGQDIFDEVFSLGDAIAYKFHEYLCQTRADETDDMKKEIGIYLTTDPVTGKTSMNMENVKDLAKEQAFKKIESDDMMFANICLYLFDKGGRKQNWEDFVKKLERIKLCGLLELLAEAIKCLLGGMELEEALGKIILAALRAMSVDNFGDLFSKLPEAKKAECEAAAALALSKGGDDRLPEDDQESEESDSSVSYSKPWERAKDKIAEHDWASHQSGPYDSMSHGEWTDYQDDPTLLGASTAAVSSQAASLDPNVVLQAYVIALIESYAGEELELLDLLGDFPGAPIISYIIATLSCPNPGFFNPTITDFIKSLQLPICRDMREIAWPTLMIPPIDKIADLWRLLMEAAKIALAQLIQKIIMMLMVKLCEIIGEAICNALELVGDIAVAAVTGNSIADAIKESICGEEVEDEVLANTVQELFQSFGNGGAAFADSTQVMQFTADISSSVTRTEAANAFLGKASPEFLTIVDNLIEYEYPDFRESLNGASAITKAFGNMGNVMPADFRQQLQAFVDDLGPADKLPANPTLCATPQQQQEFDELRCQLLVGRVSREQCDKLNSDFKNQLANDLEDLAGIMQGGLPAYIENNMPPLVSDPGCDNGILPFEPEQVAAAIAGALGSQIEMLKVAYSEDMLGNGPGQKNWGLINMVLSDTLGQPLTVHNRKTANRKNRVDFYSTWEPEDDNDADSMGTALSLMQSLPAPLAPQRGAFPEKVAEWLQTELDELSVEYDLNNDSVGSDSVSIEFKDLPGSGLFGNQVDFMKLPDFGYNVEIEPDYENDVVKFTRLPRKKTADVTLEFRDNAAGLEKYGSEFQYGFNLEVFMADLERNKEGNMVNRPERFEDEDENVVYTPSDSTRILINHIIKPLVDTSGPAAKEFEPPSDDEEEDEDDEEEDAGQEIEILAYEFMAVDNTFDDAVDLEEKYPRFAQSFTNSATEYPPQLVLLSEMVNSRPATLLSEYTDTLNELQEAISKTIADLDGEQKAWLYGAEFDTLSYDDIEYVVKDGQTLSSGGTAYQDAEVLDDDGDRRSIRNRDMIMGVSMDQLNNGDDARVTYLDPNTYGGNFMNPPLYIRPLKNNGWLGLVDVLFPELSACKPANTDLVDFGDIQDMIDEIYPTMPDDPRLFKDPDCVKEVPYDRILNRSSKAFIMGLITATIRIFCSVHIIKSLSVFIKFAPRFPEVFSSVYASYIVEAMENNLKSVSSSDSDQFALFKSNKFWYRFLEQSVQTYAFRVDQEQIEPPAHVIAAMGRLVNMQNRYDYPDREDLRDAKWVDEVPWFRFLNRYRTDENLEAVLATEEDAKIILKELVGEQLGIMSKTIVQNLKLLDMTPDIYDMDYYLLDNFAQDTSLTLNKAVDADGSFKTSYPSLPAVPYEDEESGVDEPYYTTGGDFVVGDDRDNTGLSIGEEYIGYYHVNIDEDGNTMYMAGEYHDDDAHDVLTPLTTISQILVGDVPSLDEVSSTDQPFLVEKYIRVTTDGLSHRYAPSDAVELIKANDGLLLISEVYPGTLEIVNDDQGNPVGLQGELGVRYGLKFSVKAGGSFQEVASAEMDVLDLPIGQLSTISADSAILACLIKQLINDDTFKMITQYVFPLRKMVSIMAIYTDMGFLPSIGQETVAAGASWPTFSLLALIGGRKYSADGKPGMTAITEDGGKTFTYSATPGWTNKEDRPGWFLTLGFKAWDEWDQVLLRNTRHRVEKLFKTHYNDRDFDFNEMNGRGVAQLQIKKLREAIKPASGERLLPWWRKRRLRSNPFNADGELCENED